MSIRLLCCLLLPLIVFAIPKPDLRQSPNSIITGDAFRAYADHIYDEESTLNPTLIRPRDTIFVKGDHLADFFTQVHGKIDVPYLLITHLSNMPVPGAFIPYLEDEKLLAWFGSNFDGTPHVKFHSIPRGCANTNPLNSPIEVLRKVQEKKMAKEHLAHMGITLQTNYAERWPVFKLFAQKPWVYRTVKKTFEEYLADVAASWFEIAPFGATPDTHRVWESLYVGTIPIVKTSSADELYRDLPVLIVKDWKEITEELLHAKADKMNRQTFNLEKLSIDFWLQKIEQVKSSMRLNEPKTAEKKHRTREKDPWEDYDGPRPLSGNGGL